MSVCRVAKPAAGKGKLSARDWWIYYTESHEHAEHTQEHLPRNAGDYYLGKSGDAERPTVTLIGSGVAALGLDGGHELTRQEFELLCNGQTLDGKPAVHRGADGSHVPFVGVVYSPHKSVSLLWAVGDDELRAAIQAAHDLAVRAAVASLERHTAPLRRQDPASGKVVPERTAGLVVAEVRHHTARPVQTTGGARAEIPDPQLHTHALVMNMARRVNPDGKGHLWAALDSRALLTAQKESGKVYGTSLAAELQRLGFGVARHGDAIGVAGISDELVAAFSRRHAAIAKARTAEAERLGRGLTPAERHTQVITTRLPKGEPVPTTSLLLGWQVKLAALGAAAALPDELRAAEAERRSLRIDDEDRAAALDRVTPAQVVAAAIVALSESQGTWSWQEMRTAIATEAQGHLSSAELDELLTRADEQAAATEGVVPLHALSPELVPVITQDGRAALTSKVVLARDQECVDLVAEIEEAGSALVPDWIARHRSLSLKSGDKTLTEEQKEAAWWLSLSRVSVLEAPPGTGKSVVARALAEYWSIAVGDGRWWDPRAAHFVRKPPATATIWATALPGKAASDLGAGLGEIAEVRTLDSLRRETLRADDLVIVDEASMVDQARWLPLLRQVRDAGCRLAIIGDRHQQGTVSGPGGMFAHLADRAAERGQLATIKTNYRALAAADAQAWDALRDGRSAATLDHYREQGHVVLEPSVADVHSRVVQDWAADIAEDVSSLIVVIGSNREIDDINSDCQAAMVAAGKVAADAPTVAVSYTDASTGYSREETLRVGDRVAFTRTSYLETADRHQQSARVRVNNGESLTVAEVAAGRVILSRPSDQRVSLAVDDERVNRLRLDYACSALRSQGRTVDRSRVVSHPQADRESAYVAISRAREGSWVYASIRELTDWPDGQSRDRAERQALAALAASFSRSRPQELAVTAAKRAARHDTDRKRDERLRWERIELGTAHEVTIGHAA